MCPGTKSEKLEAIPINGLSIFLSESPPAYNKALCGAWAIPFLWHQISFKNSLYKIIYLIIIYKIPYAKM